MKRTLVLFILTLACGVASASASVLQGRVVEVHDGRTMTVENTGRLIKVALKAAEAPEPDQPYGNVARRHLASLVLNRQATIEYTGLGPEAILIGRVVCEGRDVGLQMIRDGVAWFDHSYEANLGQSERNLYAESERAARDERRGIWQDAAPVPPWEWRQARASQTNVGRRAVNSEARQPAAVSAQQTSRSTQPRRQAVDAQWPVFSPSNAPFSIRIPEAGLRHTTEVPMPVSGMLNVDLYAVRHLKIGYLAVWVSAPYQGQALKTMFDWTVEKLNEMSAASSLPCEFYQEKDAPLGGFVGRRYKLRNCYCEGGLRHYYKVEGGKLTIILVGVISEIPDDPEIARFLDSFKITNSANQ